MIAECLVVEVSVTGDDCPLSAAARQTGVGIDARPPQLRRDGNALLQFSIEAPPGIEEDLPPTTIHDAVRTPEVEDRDRSVDPAAYGPVAKVLDDDDRIRYLHASRSDDRVNFRCLSKHLCVVHALTDAGFVVESLSYREEGERHTGAVVGYDVLEGVLSAGADRSAGDGVGLAIERIHPLGTEDDQPVARRWPITPAQEAAIRTALEMGYFSVPREADAGDVADELGISKSAFLERLRRGQGALFGQLFASGE